MTIGRKLILTFGVTLALAAVTGCYSFFTIGSLTETIADTSTRVAVRADLAGRMQAAMGLMRTGQRGLALYSLGKQPDKSRASNEIFRKQLRILQQSVTEVRPLIATDAGKQTIESIEGVLREWQPMYEELARACANPESDQAVIYSLVGRGGVYGERMTDYIEKLSDIQRGLMAKAAEQGTSVSSRAHWIMTVLLALTILMGTFGLLIVRSTNRTLQHAASELRRSAEQVAGAANQISASSQSLAIGASQQAASLQETSASSSEVSTLTHKNAEDSRLAAELMDQTSVTVADANRKLVQMEASMHEINSSGEKIGKIIRVIDEIAFQTNILALNAAVEAARAGASGMGFAVVAEEVRNLAQRSADAAKNTASMIEESITTSKQGRVKLDEVSNAIRSITEMSVRVKGLVHSVNASSGEQSRGITQISSSIAQVGQVTQDSAASAEETASAGEELSSQAFALRGIVGKLEHLVGAV